MRNKLLELNYIKVLQGLSKLLQHGVQMKATKINRNNVVCIFEAYLVAVDRCVAAVPVRCLEAVAVGQAEAMQSLEVECLDAEEAAVQSPVLR